MTECLNFSSRAVPREDMEWVAGKGESLLKMQRWGTPEGRALVNHPPGHPGGSGWSQDVGQGGRV